MAATLRGGRLREKAPKRSQIVSPPKSGTRRRETRVGPKRRSLLMHTIPHRLINWRDLSDAALLTISERTPDEELGPTIQLPGLWLVSGLLPQIG